MIWVAYVYYGVRSAIEVTSKVDLFEYIKLLDEHLRHELRKCVLRHFIFQQDNAPAHSVKDTKNW